VARRLGGGVGLSAGLEPGTGKKKQYSLRSGLVKEYASERYYRQNAQLQRWQAEHQQHEAVEKALADVSKFSYEPENYVRFLVKEPFQEPPRQEFQSLLPERLLAAERRYRQPILIRWGLMAALILCVAVFPNLVTVAVAAALLAVAGYLQYKLIRERQFVLAKIEKDTRLEIDAKTREQEEAIALQRKLHADSEEERIDFYVRLLNGEMAAMVMTIDEYLPKLSLPFPVDVDIDLFGNIMQVRVWLPGKALIPAERTSLSETGKIQYESKEALEINKQYAELCAALLMQVGTILFARIPTLGKIYLSGMSRDGDKKECLITLKMDRAQLERAAQSSTALVAMQTLSAIYVCDEYLKLLPVDPITPEEWTDVSARQIRNLQVKIYQRLVLGSRK
jgi:hypothetical protein